MRIALLKLTNHSFLCHGDTSWFGWAKFDIDQWLTKDNDKKSVQSQAARLLLSELLAHYEIKAQLNDAKHPYHLCDGRWVSFSHSQGQVAVAVSDMPVGVDIESNVVTPKISERFFCQDEWDYLRGLPRCHSYKLCQLLWQIKECLVKIEQINLIKGLKVNILASLTSASSEFVFTNHLNSLNHLGSHWYIELSIQGYGNYRLCYYKSNSMVVLTKLLS